MKANQRKQARLISDMELEKEREAENESVFK